MSNSKSKSKAAPKRKAAPKINRNPAPVKSPDHADCTGTETVQRCRKQRVLPRRSL